MMLRRSKKRLNTARLLLSLIHILEEKLVHLTLPKPEGDKKDTNEATKKLLNKRIVFTENLRQIESAVISTVGEELKLELTVAGEKKILFAGYKDWKCNDMYPNDFTKRYHAVSYAFDEDALYLSVGLLNTSYLSLIHI